MELNLSDSWKNVLSEELQKPYFNTLLTFVEQEYKSATCYPDISSIFRAFNLCSFATVKVVIIGQDPYHGYGQANGLCFSVPDGVKHPPSLRNIFKELEQDLKKTIPDSGDLSYWSTQGVLMLNATLTVREGQAGSHQQQGWEQFTDAVISIISELKQNVVFLLWGGFAKKKATKIDTQKHYLLYAGHPSPLSANRGYWFGNSHFSKTNALLLKNNIPIIQW